MKALSILCVCAALLALLISLTVKFIPNVLPIDVTAQNSIKMAMAIAVIGINAGILAHKDKKE